MSDRLPVGSSSSVIVLLVPFVQSAQCDSLELAVNFLIQDGPVTGRRNSDNKSELA